ncbi:MAG: argininosuccinate lyase [Candidatus Omnitrophica bacterium]|nr:argininosuccinate lyase [Candidatus Omnitrophota bacterium]
MTKKLWGGRFKKEVNREFFEFQKSIGYDYKLAEEDILHSMIHVVVLRKSDILSPAEEKRLLAALEEVNKEIKEGIRENRYRPVAGAEDIHTDIQNRVEHKVGTLAAKLHALRSRNDQVVFDEKYYCLRAAQDIRALLLNLLGNLLFLMKKYPEQPFVGYTHTQRAQAILFRHYLGAFFHMFERDNEQLKRFHHNVFLYIGAGALAGSHLRREDYNKAIKELISQGLGFEKIQSVENSLDNVSNRDFIIEFMSILSVVQMHLSRLAEDLILYSTQEFNFVDLPEEFCTGSSLMPHKKNPDFLELIRGYTGMIYGNLVAVLTTMKGLPLTYDRDMQLNKKPLFSSVETIKDELKILPEFLKKLKLNNDVIARALEAKSLYATELAEFLVCNKQVPFRDAHTLVGKMIRYAEDKGKQIDSLSDAELKKFCPSLTRGIIKTVMNPRYAIASKKSISHKNPRIRS